MTGSFWGRTRARELQNEALRGTVQLQEDRCNGDGRVSVVAGVVLDKIESCSASRARLALFAKTCWNGWTIKEKSAAATGLGLHCHH